MATYVNDLRLKEIATGDEAGTWGTSTNTNLELIAEAMGVGAEAVANASTHTITMADGATDQFRSTFLRLTGGGQACTVTLAPNTLSHTWIMRNETAAVLTLTQGSGANVAIAAGQTKIVATDGAGSGAIVYEMDDLELAGNLAVGGTLVSTGKITADAGIDIDNINIDGTTIALSSGDLTLDVAGDIILDFDGGDLRFKDGGTEIGLITSDGSNLGIFSRVSDKDIIFYGNDGGSTITALTLDMSEAGDATFNNFVTADRFYIPDNGLFIAGGGGDLKLSSDGTNALIEAVTGNLLVDVVGDITLDADGDEIFFKRGGVNGGKILMASGVFSIGPEENNGDFKIIGIDGGAGITACTFDMSEGGAATFNSSVEAQGLVSVGSTTTNGVLKAFTADISNGENNGLNLFNSSGSDQSWFVTPGLTGQNNTSFAIRDATNDLNAMFIAAASGQLTSNSSVNDDYGLEIKNGSSTNPYGLQIQLANGTSNTTQALIVAQSAGANKFVVFTNGDVTNVNNSYGATSDLKLKENIADAASQWDDLKAVRVRNYSLIADNESSANLIGVVAQELEASGMSGLVYESPDQIEASDGGIENTGEVTKGIKYSVLYMKAIKALQEAMTRIETLEAKVQTLENP